jgi:Tol biopolymer transport system component
MGEVYKAKDTRLDRTVAVKVLPAQLSSSTESRQRFEREAKTISQLSHPHICALYDVGSEGETEYLVMEYLEGETLAARLARAALPLDQTLRFGTEIADALDKAHRQGIVHRDLKPGNVMLTKSGVKLLDFGLAKAIAPPTEKGNLTSLPTQQGLTQQGTILGTFQYMAPEQLEGKNADARTDIFAFGAVLYEMATGKKAFSGASQASLISSIMTAEPPSISTAQPMSPPALDRVVKTCLVKDPEDRWQSAADIKRELRWIGEGAETAVAGRVRKAWLPWAIAVVATIAAVGVTYLRRLAPDPAPHRMELSIVMPERMMLSDFFALSPDGSRLAFVAVAGGKSLLRVRDLRSSEIRGLPGTESAEAVFWSPDGRSVGFVSRGKLRRADVATGSVDALADAESGRGGSWGSRGDIIFARKAAGGIYRVAASGGSVTEATTLEKGDLLHRWPQFLPDGRRFLFFVKTGSPETTGTYIAALDKPGRTLVLRNNSTGVFAPSGKLLYCRGTALIAQAFDPDTGQLSGSPETLTRPVTRAERSYFMDDFTVSQSGVIVLRSASALCEMTWVDRRGNVVGKLGEPGVITSATLSPNQREAAITIRTVETGAFATFVLDLERGALTPFVESAAFPVWLPDGHSLVYRQEGQSYNLHRRTAHGDQTDDALGAAGPFIAPHSVSPDGRYVLYSVMGNNFDVGVKDLRSDEKAATILRSEFDERSPHFSPDGRWITYSSDEPGQTEVFVRRFPVTEEVWRVSTSGGQQPTWSRDGSEIFFLSLDGRIMSAPVSTTGGKFTSGSPLPLFRAALRLYSVANQYAVSSDGQRFLLLMPTQALEEEPFRVLLNWQGRP